MREPWLRGALVGFSLTAVAACTSAPEPPKSKRVDANIEQNAPSPAGDARSPAFLSGYFEARDGGLFTACGETSRRRVQSIDAGTLSAIAKANEALDRPRFLIAEGNLVGREAVDIGRFNIVAGDAWACDSRLDDFIVGARGSDVLWNLEVTQAAVSFSAAPGAPPEVHAFVGFQPSPRGLTLNAGKAEFSAALKAEPCIEALTDTSFGWSIVVNAGGKVFTGCAWRGLAAP